MVSKCFGTAGDFLVYDDPRRQNERRSECLHCGDRDECVKFSIATSLHYLLEIFVKWAEDRGYF